MQRFFPYEVCPETVLTANAGTFQRALPSRGVITQLDIWFAATNGTTFNQGSPIWEVVNQIEITGDGVDKIFSMHGLPAFKYLSALKGKYLTHQSVEYGGGTQYLLYSIPFGRYYGDKEYGLKLDRYNEVRVDINYDLAAVNSVGTTGFVSGSGIVHIVAHMTTPGVTLAPRGVRRVAERMSYTTAASGEVSYDFVQDYPYTAVGVYCREPGISDGTDISDIRLDLGAGKPVVFDYEFLDILDLMNEWYPGKYEMDMVLLRTSGDTPAVYTGDVLKYDIEPVRSLTIGTTDSHHYHVSSIAGDVMTLQGFTIEGSGTWGANAEDSTDRRLYVRAKGYHVGNLALVPLADTRTWDDPLLPAEASDATLYMTQGGAGGTAYVITEQILPQ